MNNNIVDQLRVENTRLKLENAKLKQQLKHTLLSIEKTKETEELYKKSLVETKAIKAKLTETLDIMVKLKAQYKKQVEELISELKGRKA